MRWLLNLLKRLFMNPEKTNQLFEDTNPKIIRVAFRSRNDLPDKTDYSTTVRILHNSISFFTGGAAANGEEDLINYNFDNSLELSSYIKRIQSGKQVLNKPTNGLLYPYTYNGSSRLVITNGMVFDNTDGTTACEYYYILYTLESV